MTATWAFHQQQEVAPVFTRPARSRFESHMEAARVSRQQSRLYTPTVAQTHRPQRPQLRPGPQRRESTQPYNLTARRSTGKETQSQQLQAQSIGQSTNRQVVEQRVPLSALDAEHVEKLGSRPWRRERSDVVYSQPFFLNSGSRYGAQGVAPKPASFNESKTTYVAPITRDEQQNFSKLSCLLDDKNAFENITGFTASRFYHHKDQIPAGGTKWGEPPKKMTAVFPQTSVLADSGMTSNKFFYKWYEKDQVDQCNMWKNEPRRGFAVHLP